MRLVITIIILVAYFLFKGVGSAIGRSANVPTVVENPDAFDAPDLSMPVDEPHAPRLGKPIPSSEAMAALKARLMAKHSDKMTTQKQTVKAETYSATNPAVTVNACVEPKPEAGKYVIDDPKKLIIYSEIMKPKFDE